VGSDHVVFLVFGKTVWIVVQKSVGYPNVTPEIVLERLFLLGSSMATSEEIIQV